MMNRNKWILFFCFTFLVQCVLSGQEFLQLETINDPESIKIAIGDKITFKTKQVDEWQTEKIEKFVYDQQMILFESGYVYLADITYIKRYRHIIGALSNKLMQFGGAYLVYGGITGLVGLVPFTVGNLILGGGAVIIGYGLKKAFYTRIYKMGTRYKVRLLDLRVL